MPQQDELQPQNVMNALGKDALGFRNSTSDLIENESNEDFLMHALRALDYPEDKANYPLGFQILNETRNLIDLTHWDTGGETGLSFTHHQKFDWHQGAFEMTIAQAYGGSVRIFEAGILADQSGNVVIKKMQKHRLGHEYRRDINETGNPEQIKEKKAADHILKHMKKSLGFPPELLGFLATSALLGPHAKEGRILFTTVENHPEIRRRRLNLQRIELRSGWWIPETPINILHKENVDEIARISPLVDFSTMLASINVPTYSERPGYLYAKFEDLHNIFKLVGSEGKGRNRDIFPQILTSLYESQAS